MENNGNPGGYKDLLSAALGESGLTDDLDEFASDFTGFSAGFGGVQPVSQVRSSIRPPTAGIAASPFVQVQKQPVRVGNSGAQQVIHGNVTPQGTTQSGQQFRRVIIKTPQGQQQVLQRVVTTSTPTSDPALSQLINTQGQKTLISQHGNTIVSGQKVLTLTQQGIAANAARTPARAVSVTPQQTLRPGLSPKVVTVPQYNGGFTSHQSPGVSVVPSLLQAQRSVGYDQLAKPGLPQATVRTPGATVVSQIKSTAAASAPQGTPKIVTVRQMAPHAAGQSPLVMNTKGEQVPVRVIKVAKTDGSVQRPSAAASTPSSGPRIVKIMTTPRGSSPMTVTQAQGGVRRVIMQSFTKAQTNATDSVVQDAKVSQLAVLPSSPQAVKSTVVTTQPVTTNPVLYRTGGTFSSTGAPSVGFQSVPLTTDCDITKQTMALSSVSNTVTLSVTRGTVSVEGLNTSTVSLPAVKTFTPSLAAATAQSPATKTEMAHKATTVLSSNGTHSVISTSNINPVLSSKGSVQGSNTINVTLSSSAPGVNTHSHHVMSCSGIGSVKAGVNSLPQPSNASVGFKESLGSPDVIVIDDCDETIVCDKSSKESLAGKPVEKGEVGNDSATNSVAKSDRVETESETKSVDEMSVGEVKRESADVRTKVDTVPDTLAEEKPDEQKQAEDTQSSTATGGDMLGFGSLFGDDDPFFQALAQLQDTNKKAKVFEEKVKAGRIETSEVVSDDISMETDAPMSSNSNQNGPGVAVAAADLAVPTMSTNSHQPSLAQQKTMSIGGMAGLQGQMNPQHVSSIGSMVGRQGLTNPQGVFKPNSPHTAAVTVLREGQGLGSTVGLLQRIPSPLNVQVKPGGTSQFVSSQSHDRYSPPTVIGTSRGGRVNSPVTIVQRVNSPLGVSSVGASGAVTVGGPGSTQMFRVVTQSLGSPAPSTPTVKYITTPRSNQSLHTPLSNQSLQTPLRTVQSTPRMLPMSVQRENLQCGQKFTIGHDGIQRMVPNTPSEPLMSKLTDRDVSRLWVNDDLKLRNIQHEMSRSESPGLMLTPGGGAARAVEEEAEEEEEELGIAETFAEYMPAKLKIGQRHPDPVVESSSLSSVEPQDVYYVLSIPEHVIDYGSLSALQLETITYCCQKHQVFLPSGQRAGFLIGDGAGVGKGRTIAGIIYENYLQGRKRALWMSVSNDLRVDAERDLRDIGASKVEVHPLNKFKYAKISSGENGKVKKGVIFSTYSSLIGESSAKGKYRTRFKQLIHWLGKDFDGLIVFDECHRAKNLCPVGSSKPTKTGMTVLELQNKLPKARVVYASATGASEPRNMAYMTRLGLWGPGTPFKEFMDFIQAVEKRGVGAMELVAMDMKLRGMYIARQLSFKGVNFKIESVSISKDFTKVYNDSVKLWVEARDAFQKSASLMGSEQRTMKTMWGQFWSSHQRFFKYLCIHAKLHQCVKIARQAVKSGKCVVIGLQSTGEARTMEQLEEYGEITDFVSTAKGVLQSLIDRHFPAPSRKKAFDFSSLFEDSTDSFKVGHKRKKEFTTLSPVKRRKEDWSDDSDSDSNDKKASDSDGALGGSDDDKSDHAASETEESEESEPEDFNPFGSGDDSDEDPWLKKAKRKAKKKKVKGKKDEKKESKKKPKKDKKKRHNDSGDEFQNIDNMFDQALQAAGLKSKTNENNDIPGSAPALSIGADDIDQAAKLKEKLLTMLERLGDDLPANTLDQLIDDLGGTECVAEMTGRKGRVVSTENGSVQYESRSEQDIPLEIMNLAEKQRFMDGEKFIAVISEAASSGISLQADRRVANQRRRVHITLELPWSADRAIQQFGRTHRSNQVSGPEYIFLISSLAGERRFASTVSKRLESLGALTHGDRRATDTRDLSQFNIDNKYGKTALESTMKSILGLEQPLVPPPTRYSGRFFHDAKLALVGVGLVSCDERYGVCSLEKDYNNISKFLNRILGMEVELQNHLFQYFTENLAAICLQAKRNGRWDMGILDLGSTTGESVKRLETKAFVGTFSGSKTRIELNTVSVERGMSYSEAMRVWHEHSAPDDGFYLANQEKNSRRAVVLVTLLQGKNKERLYNLYKPNTGLQAKAEALTDVKKKYKKVLPEVARSWWLDQFSASANMCSHAFWKGSCRRASLGGCEIGLRSRQYYILSGSVLSVWTTVERVLATTPGNYASRMQIIRLRTDDGKKIVGTLIPHNAVQPLTSILSQESRIYNTQHGQSDRQLHNELTNASSLLSSAFATPPANTTHTQFAQMSRLGPSAGIAGGSGSIGSLKHYASSPANLSRLDSLSMVTNHQNSLQSNVTGSNEGHGHTKPFLSMPTSLF